MDSSQIKRFRSTFGYLLLLNMVATFVNVIDDTDEVHGYWEVLHYLTYGRGLQTWEYAPQFAIRTYAYVAAFLPITKLLSWVGISKVDVFSLIRVVLATLSAYCGATFMSAIEVVFGSAIKYLSVIYLAFSPGVLTATTAFLPSATAMNLVMLGTASWLRGDKLMCVLWGSIAVFLTGWPFVGVLFLLPGLEMLTSLGKGRAAAAGAGAAAGGAGGTGVRADNEVTLATGSSSLVVFCLQTLAIAASTYIVGRVVDHRYYGFWADPTRNILSYNAGGNGDNLYGTEPAMYYVRNLVLTCGPAFPLAASSPLLLLREYGLLPYLPPRKKAVHAERVKLYFVIMATALVWLLLLFSRPHKEERFMYPVYPLLSLMAGFTSVTFLDLLGDLISILLSEPLPATLQQDMDELIALSSLPAGGTKTEKIESAQAKRKGWGIKLRELCTGALVTLTVAFCFLRCGALQENYGGYTRIWKSVAEQLPQREQLWTPVGGIGRDITVCTGGEWYRYASSFHLPDNARLVYVKDTFHGLLPQYFHEPDDGDVTKGTSHPAANMNDLNQEEPTRYVDIHDCDYVVASLDKNAPDPRVHSPMLSKMTILHSHDARQKLIDEELDLTYFEPVTWERVLDIQHSLNPVARAFMLPGYSAAHNRYIHYNLYARVQM